MKDISLSVWRIVERHRAAAPPASSNNIRFYGGLRWRGLAAELLAYAAYRYAEDAGTPTEPELEVAADVIRKRFGLSSGSRHTLRTTPETFPTLRQEVLSKMPKTEEDLEWEREMLQEHGPDWRNKI